MNVCDGCGQKRGIVKSVPVGDDIELFCDDCADSAHIDQAELGYDPDCPPCGHCGAFITHWTEYHGDYDCHCESCGRVFTSREQQAALAGVADRD